MQIFKAKRDVEYQNAVVCDDLPIVQPGCRLSMHPLLESRRRRDFSCSPKIKRDLLVEGVTDVADFEKVIKFLGVPPRDLGRWRVIGKST